MALSLTNYFCKDELDDGKVGSLQRVVQDYQSHVELVQTERVTTA